MSNNENNYIENVASYFAPVAYAAACGVTAIGLVYGFKKTITNFDNGIYNAGSTLVSDIYSLISSIVTVSYTAAKYLIYVNIPLAGGAIIVDLAISYNIQSIKFDLFDKYTTLFNFQKDVILKDICGFITKEFIPFIGELIKQSVKTYYGLSECTVTNIKSLPGNDDQDQSRESKVKAIKTQKAKNTTIKEYIKLELNLEQDVKVISYHLVKNGVKLYVTNEEKKEINTFFDENKLEVINKDDYQYNTNKFVESNDMKLFLATGMLYNKLKDQPGIPEDYQYCKDEREETKCSQKSIAKIVNYCSDLVDYKSEKVNQINTSIIETLKSSGYQKEQVEESIKHCNDVKYDELICSPLFEGAANEYFDSIQSLGLLC